METCRTTSSDDLDESPYQSNMAKSAVELVNVEAEHANPESRGLPGGEPVHPYLEDIMKCPCNEWQLTKKDPVPFKSLEKYPYTIVDKKDLLDETMEKLRNEKEIAITTKRYGHDSFRGKSCLIQIATHSEVFLVDTMALKDDIAVLNEVLTCTGVLKVMHMAEKHIVNLQEDLGLYIVNMICLFAAWRALNPTTTKKTTILKHATTAGLLKKHCSVEFRTFEIEFWGKKGDSSWHARPLSDDHVKYARLEVQYLVHVYQKLRNSLIDIGHLSKVYEECQNMSKIVWHPDQHGLKENWHLLAYKRLGRGNREKLNRLQLEVFKVLYEWRYITAQKHDKPKAGVLRDFTMYHIALSLPKDAEGIKECAKKCEKEGDPYTISPLTEENLEVLCGLIAKVVARCREMPGVLACEEKVPFDPNTEESAAGSRKRKEKCPICGKNAHNIGDQCSQKKEKHMTFWQLKKQKRDQEQVERDQNKQNKQNNRPSRGRLPYNTPRPWRYEQPSYSANSLMGTQLGFMVPQRMPPNGFFGNQSRSGWHHERFRY